MDDETEYERVTRRVAEAKYSRENGRPLPLSAQKGSDLAPVLWIAFFAVAFVVLAYLGSNGG